MTGKSEKPIHIKQNISSLDQQIRAKEKLAQKITLPVSIDQITEKEGPNYDVEATLIINAFCFSF